MTMPNLTSQDPPLSAISALAAKNSGAAGALLTSSRGSRTASPIPIATSLESVDFSASSTFGSSPIRSHTTESSSNIDGNGAGLPVHQFTAPMLNQNAKATEIATPTRDTTKANFQSTPSSPAPLSPSGPAVASFPTPGDVQSSKRSVLAGVAKREGHAAIAVVGELFGSEQ